MKKTGIMNKEISAVIAGMGHNDMLMICGSAYPIPDNGHRIDLALEPGLPGFLDVIRVVLKELEVEGVYVAAQTKRESPRQFEGICALFPALKPNIVEQSELKELGYKAKAYIRTGECTPFSNIVLAGGVIF